MSKEKRCYYRAKKRHQAHITEKDAEIISLALYWYMQYIPYKDIITCKKLYDKFSRIHQILKQN